jgi:hypothetical protein
LNASKPLIFVVISTLIIALIYSSCTPFIVYAAPEAGWRSSQDCTVTSFGGVLCCWKENGVEYCQTCIRIPYGTPGTEEGGWECTTKEKSLEQPPTSSPFDPTAPLQGGVLEQPPTPPSFDPTAPLQGGVLEQQPPTPPPSAPGASPGILEQLQQGEGVSPELGFSERQQLQPPPAEQGAAEPPPATEETQPATVKEEQPMPVCQEGLEFNEDLGFCVPEDCPEGLVLDEESGICVLEEPETAEEEPAQSEPGEQPSDEPDQEGDTNNN